MTREIFADFAVVGSGAGGSVLAYHLARNGERVVLLERGRRIPPEAMNHDELEMLALLYRDGGSFTNNEADMFVLQGSCVGGSTVLTNAVCFRMPERVRAGFADRGFELPRERLAAAYQRVESVLNVHLLEERLYNPAAWRLIEGMRARGIEPGRFRKAMLGCVGCGYCNMGCRYGRKMDASVTWVPMAEARGAEVLPETEVVRVETRHGAVTGLRCRDLRGGGELRVRAERYVVAGGAIATPELLLRSGILPRLVGRRTSFNAGAILFGEYPDPVDGSEGDQMCVYHFGEGYAIEQIQNPPMSSALTMAGWATRHAERMRRYRNLGSAGVLVPTKPAGRVFLGLGYRVARPLFDHADLRFRLPEEDLAALRRGLEEAARIYFASGATRVILPLARGAEVDSPGDLDRLGELLADQKDLVGFGSSHPQGGCCLGDDERRDPVAPDFRVRGLGNLYVCDASLFPGCVEVNPMLTIMAVADLAVRHIGGFPPAARIEEGPAWEARREPVTA